MMEITNSDKCTGCCACANICPKRCINMISDSEGFCYPDINKNDCINCELCISVCQSENPITSNGNSVSYAAYNKDENIRMQSSSGGVFTLLAEWIIDNGGVVFGAAYDNDFNVIHICIEEKENLYKLRGSKYVQSKIGDSYKKAKQMLDDNILVLFAGTPCQINGLIQYLKKDYKNLYTQDIICHGVPSPMVWKKYINYREIKSASKTQRTFFRHKKYGWKMYSVQFIYTNCTEYIQIHKEDLYMRGFLRNLSLRPSCYNCNSRGDYRNSDITLADFWGINNILPEMNDDKGCSLVIVNSQKGAHIFNAIKDKMVLKSVNFNEAVKMNRAIFDSPTKPKNRGKFFDDIQNSTFEEAVMRNTRKSKLLKLKVAIRKMMKNIVK